MLNTEMQHSATALIFNLDGGCTSNDAECIRMLTETTFGDSVGESTLSSFSRLGAKFLAEEAYVLDVYRRLDDSVSLPGSPVF